MRKIILNLAVSLDGFIEGPNGEYDWCFTDQDYGMTDFLDSTDAIFIGRKSYELLVGAGPNPFINIKTYVFSDTLTPGTHEDVVLVSKADFATRVDEILTMEGKNIWLFGGAELAVAFVTNNLVSDMQLSVHPVILGGGKPLFGAIKERTELVLVDQKTYSTGLVQLTYKLKPRFDMSMLDI